MSLHIVSGSKAFISHYRRFVIGQALIFSLSLSLHYRTSGRSKMLYLPATANSIASDIVKCFIFGRHFQARQVIYYWSNASSYMPVSYFTKLHCDFISYSLYSIEHMIRDDYVKFQGSAPHLSFWRYINMKLVYGKARDMPHSYYASWRAITLIRELLI